MNSSLRGQAAELAVLNSPLLTPLLETLPATAINLPMIALFGLGVLSAAVIVGFPKKRAY